MSKLEKLKKAEKISFRPVRAPTNAALFVFVVIT